MLNACFQFTGNESKKALVASQMHGQYYNTTPKTCNVRGFDARQSSFFKIGYNIRLFFEI